MTRLRLSRRWLFGLTAFGALVAVALWPTAITVDVTTVTRGPLTVTLDEDGDTRVHHRFVVSAPLAGRVERIDLDPGDAVAQGAPIARLHAEPAQFLDARSRAEAAAAVEAARGLVGRARAEEQRARAALALAAADLAREEALDASGLTTRQNLDARRSASATAREALNAADFAVAAATADLERARARLLPAALDGGGRTLTVTAPVDGVVLRRFLDSESVVAAGAKLVELGDPSHVEVVADLLSSDAVRVRPGMRVALSEWGGERALGGVVERVEPSGFTKVSALGVEEQRVNVIIDVDDDRAAWTAMGDGFRVEVAITLWHADDVVTVPTGALFRAGTEWAVFVVTNGRARRTPLTLGHRTPLAAEVTAGLDAGARVVVHPPDTLADGDRVTPRQ
jgi:HlyD family secretion protein